MQIVRWLRYDLQGTRKREIRLAQVSRSSSQGSWPPGTTSKRALGYECDPPRRARRGLVSSVATAPEDRDRSLNPRQFVVGQHVSRRLVCNIGARDVHTGFGVAPPIPDWLRR